MQLPSRFLGVVVSILAAATVAACGRGGAGEIRKDSPAGATGSGAGDGTTTGGTRLVPLTYRGSDGSKAFAGLFDKELGKECAFDRLGSVAVCVPTDVYTVTADVFGNSLNTASPALYLDSKCGDRKAIALDESAACTHYGVVRMTASRDGSSDFPGCAQGAYGTGLAVVTPVPAGTKIYAWGQGGGQCCTCAEWVPPAGGTLRAYFVETSPAESDIANVKLVTGTLDDPTKL
jgi:hypothetical protein